MIWDKQIHGDRSLEEWIGNPSTGFSPKLLAIIKAQEGKLPFDNPREATQNGMFMLFSGFDDVAKVARIIKSFAGYVDTALWVEGRNIAHKLRNKKCHWLDMSWRDAVIVADILVISDIPPPSDTFPANTDRQELEWLITTRIQKGKGVTLILGPNHTNLQAIQKYSEINKALKEATKNE